MSPTTISALGFLSPGDGNQTLGGVDAGAHSTRSSARLQSQTRPARHIEKPVGVVYPESVMHPTYSRQLPGSLNVAKSTAFLPQPSSTIFQASSTIAQPRLGTGAEDTPRVAKTSWSPAG